MTRTKRRNHGEKQPKTNLTSKLIGPPRTTKRIVPNNEGISPEHSIPEEDSITTSTPQSGDSAFTSPSTSTSTSKSTSTSVKFVKSLFPHRPPTIAFDYPNDLNLLRHERVLLSVSDQENQLPTSTTPDTTLTEDICSTSSRKLFYKCYWERNCIKKAFETAGFQRKKKKSTKEDQWCCAWIKHPPPEFYSRMNQFQKVNHFPGTWCLGRKDRLLRCMNRAGRRKKKKKTTVKQQRQQQQRVGDRRDDGNGDDNDDDDDDDDDDHDRFHPEGWHLPREYESWLKTAKRDKEDGIFILKPSAQSCGRGIRLIHKGNYRTVPRNKPCVVQRYIKRPYLINGKKFDLRLYVLVTSFDPLRAYVYKEGLVRFSSHSYSTKNLSCRFVHLTNYSINKKSKYFIEPSSESDDCAKTSSIDSSNKWSLSTLWNHLENVEGEKKLRRCQEGIKDVIVKSLIAAEEEITPNVNRIVKVPGRCYELFGFDIMLDKNLKAWLIEVNVSPSLMGSSPLDKIIKGTLLPDLFHLVGLVPYDTSLEKKECSGATKISKNATQKSTTAGRRLRQELWRQNPLDPLKISLNDLTLNDWEIIYDLEDEYVRRGNFLRVFPIPNQKYLEYFQTPRFNNALLCAWLIIGRPSYRKNYRRIMCCNDANSNIFRQSIKSLINVRSNKKLNSSQSKRRQRDENNSMIPGANCAMAILQLEPLENDQWRRNFGMHD